MTDDTKNPLAPQAPQSISGQPQTIGQTPDIQLPSYGPTPPPVSEVQEIPATQSSGFTPDFSPTGNPPPIENVPQQPVTFDTVAPLDQAVDKPSFTVQETPDLQSTTPQVTQGVA